MFEVCLPELGEGIAEATIACFHYSEGDQVHIDDDVVEVVTDKATFYVPSEHDGTIKKICYKEGDSVPIGSPLFVLEKSAT